ncbi:unnamed protein product [Protopolystoma xenopodis]|uniref:Uncharacterized protein n=1 Tax=Protopolystoma xenopodis TaxID=117903 RepID=A0A3S5CRI8_9PLAT|nr:unnamed protein product [Protopolystoma xenopodis]
MGLSLDPIFLLFETAIYYDENSRDDEVIDTTATLAELEKMPHVGVTLRPLTTSRLGRMSSSGMAGSQSGHMLNGEESLSASKFLFIVLSIFRPLTFLSDPIVIIFSDKLAWIECFYNISLNLINTKFLMR